MPLKNYECLVILYKGMDNIQIELFLTQNPWCIEN